MQADVWRKSDIRFFFFFATNNKHCPHNNIILQTLMKKAEIAGGFWPGHFFVC